MKYEALRTTCIELGEVGVAWSIVVKVVNIVLTCMKVAQIDKCVTKHLMCNCQLLVRT